MCSAPRVNPNVLVSISVGLKVWVSLIAKRCAEPLFGPLPQGSEKFLKQLKGVLLFQPCEYLNVIRFFSLKRWSILISNWSPELRVAPDPIQLS